MNSITIFFSIFLSVTCFAQQPTIGLRLSSMESSDGYTLFTPEKNNFVYLIDNCGRLVNTWEFSERPAITCYLLENGNLLRAGIDSLEIRDWNNQLVWSYAITSHGFPQHHDIEPMPNGNILVVSKESFDDIELLELGRNPALGNANFTLDVIYELQPIGTNEAQLVWEWKFSDHLIQEFDNTKSNFGVVSDFPELLDINFDNGQAVDYTHVNAVDFNPTLNQVLITSRHLSELYILDHSTTLIEASGHVGGSKGKGGDFLYRWGNAQVYQGGNVSDQLLHLPHDGKWVNEDCPNYGKLTVFNNLGDGVVQASSVHVIEPVIVNDVYQMNSGAFLPSNYFWSWSGTVLGDVIYETKKCGMIELQNGNHMIGVNSTGTIIEVDQNGEVIWVYKNPSGYDGNIYQQNETVVVNGNIIFRAERYAPDFIGFIGKDLTASGTIEDNNSESSNCAVASTIEESIADLFSIQNPVTSQILQFKSVVSCEEMTLYHLNGKIQKSVENFNGESIELNCLPGVYFLKIRNGSNFINQKIIIL